ncbi:hypothetical protein BGZ94_006479 [Podila epigama]|nr:hypothetical protein BGZ94_006479 [Podila epigama]
MRCQAARPTVVPQHIQELYANTFYGSGDLQSECLSVYKECGERLAKLLNFEAEVQKGGSVVIMSGEAMVGLWGGLKSVIPWPCQKKKDPETGRWLLESEHSSYKVLCVGNGVFGCGMGDMVDSLRYPNVDVRLVESRYDQPINVEKAIQEIKDWKPDLVTMVHCDTPTGVLNSDAIKRVGEECSRSNTLFYVDVVSSAGAVPVDISGWNIDIGLVGTQKAFSLEPSLAIITVSTKAWKQIEEVGYTGYDAILPFKTVHQTAWFPYTPLWSGLDALNVQLKTTYGEESQLTNEVYARHETVAQYCRERIQKMGLSLWWSDELVSLNSAVATAVRVPSNTTWEVLDEKLRKEGVIFGGSFGETANAIFRIGHMGTQADMETVRYALDVLERIVKDL